MKIDSRYQNIIRTDSKVSISTIGLLGDSKVDITRGTQEGMVIPDGGFIQGTEEGEGTLGQFLVNKSVYDNADAVVREAHMLVSDARTGNGTMGRLISDDALYTKVMQIGDRLDLLVRKVESGNGTAGKFINDPTLYNRFNDLTTKVAGITDRIDRGEGTVG